MNIDAKYHLVYQQSDDGILHQNLRFEKQIVFLVNSLIQVRRFVFCVQFSGVTLPISCFSGAKWRS